ncbi:MAG: carboxymuconolactone decarboxylase family protein [Ktedonobacterales bacterium]
MKARIANPAMSVPGAFEALQALGKVRAQGGLPQKTLLLVLLRASQINGCSMSAHMHARDAKKAGETDERLSTVATWRDSPYFSDAERAALALTEAATRLSDQADPVPDDVFDEAAKHYEEPALAALILNIALINAFNRINVTTQQVAGEWAS